ncbi:MAG: hypothetical protein Q7Q71_13355 [Verrucomicrobiota bacterium JB023]|nr:hypothetical protein [Verrucomicrobiota bacterium JB023]
MPKNPLHPLLLETFIAFALAHPARFQQLRTYLWQYREAVTEERVSWSDLSHLSALNEGIAREILRHIGKLGQSAIRKLKAPAAIDPGQQEGTAKARFYHAQKIIGYSWETFEETFEAWKRIRNPLAHGEYSKAAPHLNQQGLETFHLLVRSFNLMTLCYIGFPKAKFPNTDQWSLLG